jgi:protein O-GlcNAc transferase
LRLRIGYVSSDFGNHPLSHLTQSLYGMHNNKLFEIFCYALNGPDGSGWRRRIENEVEHFKDISQLHSGEAAQLIHNDGIHVLINMNGYTKGSRNEIFALHPAPIQMSWMGFPGTTGADYIEYIIGDNTVIPTEYRNYYSEKVISMPHSYLITDHNQTSRHIIEAHTKAKNDAMNGVSGNGDDDADADDLPPVPNSSDIQVPKRSKYGISEDVFVFCCFNQLYKIDPEVFKTWCNILKRTPKAVLWLLKFPPLGERNLMLEAEKHGISKDQLIFSDVCPRDEHILRGFLADLCLDTPEYNGHSTAADMLWSGTPIITCKKEKMCSRVCTSLLKGLGMDELSVDNLLDYEELAVSLATDQERLYSLRSHIENVRETSATFDTKRWVHNVEKGILAAWSNYECGDPLGDIDIEDNEATYTISDNGLM